MNGRPDPNTAAAQSTDQISLRVAIAVFAAESYQPPRSWAERAYPNLTYFNKVAKGGHFAAWEEPDCSLPSSAPGSDPSARTHQTKCPRPFHHQRTFT